MLLNFTRQMQSFIPIIRVYRKEQDQNSLKMKPYIPIYLASPRSQSHQLHWIIRKQNKIEQNYLIGYLRTWRQDLMTKQSGELGLRGRLRKSQIGRLTAFGNPGQCLNINYQIEYKQIKMKLSKEEKVRYARIMYNSEGREKQEIDLLTQQQLEKLRSIYAQKIAFQAVNGHIEPYYDDQQNHVYRGPRIPSLLTSVCCCFYPEQNRDYFDITTSTFFQRLFYPFLFWRNTFLDINDGKGEQYGLVWMIVTYTIILGLSSALNEYFIEPENYKFENEIMMKALGLAAVFKVAEPLIYSAVIGCLGGFIYTNQSLMVSSYSLVLYFVPTLFCMVPSLYWHIAMLAAGGFFRTIFLYRNYSTRVESKPYIIMFVIIIVELIFFFVVYRSMFYNDVGYGPQQGFNAVFGEEPKIQEAATTTEKTKASSESKQEHQLYQLLRNFEY